MNHHDRVLPVLLQAAKTGRIELQLLRRLAIETGEHQPALLNRLSDHVARSYDSGLMPYSEADAIMNAAFGLGSSEEFWAENDRIVPEPMFSIYLAFDAGEYVHPGDSPNADPEATYTRPAIRAYIQARSDPSS